MAINNKLPLNPAPNMMQTTSVGGTPPQQYAMTQPLQLPALDGSQYVARTTGGTQNTQSPTQMVNQMWQGQGGGTYTPGPRTSLESMFGNLGTNQQNFDPTVDIVNNTMAGIMNPGNAYIASARRAGLEQANARGGLNSSIAAGSAQRAAIDAGMPMFQQAMGLTSQREGQQWQGRENELARAMQQQGMRADVLTQREAQDLAARQADLDRAQQRAGMALDVTTQRENRAFQGQQAALDRTQGVNNALLGSQLQQRQALLNNQLQQESAILDTELRSKLQSDAATQQDWLADRSYTRQFNGNLSMMPVQSAFQLNNMISQYAMENPEVYSPEIISGMTNFLSRNMLSMLQQYFPSMVTDSSAAGGTP